LAWHAEAEHSCRPSSLRQGGWNSGKTQCRGGGADRSWRRGATERIAASFCLSHPGSLGGHLKSGHRGGQCFRKTETARRIPRYIESTSGGAWGEIPRTFALFKSRESTFCYAQLSELYLVYLLNQEGENGSLKNIDLYDQKTAPLTPNSFIYN